MKTELNTLFEWGAQYAKENNITKEKSRELLKQTRDKIKGNKQKAVQQFIGCLSLSDVNPRKLLEEERHGKVTLSQLQPTPILYGKDAYAVLEQIKQKPTIEQIQKCKERSKFFDGIRKKGLG